MRQLYQYKRNKGIGLLEVLITTVVVAVGLLSVASMQGNFMSESATNKTRAEAMVLAEQKIEELRNYISRDKFPNPTINASEDITGVNADFTRNWQTSAGAPSTVTPRIGLIVTVSWGNQSDQKIALTSQIAYVEPSNTAGLASGLGEISHLTGPGVGAPSPNARASERAPGPIDLFNPDGTLKPGFTLVQDTTDRYQDEEGKIYRRNGGGLTGSSIELIAKLVPFDIDLRYEVNNAATLPDNPIRLYTKRADLDNITGNEVIDLYIANVVGGIGDGSNMFDAGTQDGTEVGNQTLVLDGTATWVHRYSGGVILSIKGAVHTVNNLDDIKIDHNREDMYCVFKPGENQHVRNYACYTGGNCNVSVSGAGYITNITDGTNDATTCPNPSVAAVKVGPGGWRGNVGLINVDDDGGGKESVCFLEEIKSLESQPSTARKFKGMLDGQEQGVNQSYSCQDFLIVGRRNNFSQLAGACAVAIGSLNVVSLPPKEAVRTFTSGSNNVVVGINETFCNNLQPKDYTLTINVTNSIAETVAEVSGGTSGGSCTGGPETFTCSGTTKANELTVNASAPGGATGSCAVTLDTSVTSPTGSCNITLVSPPIYTLNGTISGSTGQAPTVTITDDFTVFSKPCTVSGTTFSCQIQTTYSSVRILGSKKGKNSPYCTVSDLNLQPGQSETRNNVCELKY